MIKKILFFSILFLFSQAILAQPPVKQITKGVVNGSAVDLPKPAYPAAAQALKASGEVKVQVTIDEQGNVISSRAISGHPLLRQTAEQAAWQAKFKPTLLEGRPVKVTGTILYNFITPVEPAANAQPDEIWAIGVVFALLEKADDEMLKQLDAENDFSKDLLELAKDIPEEISKEKPLIEKLSKSTGAERQRLAGELAATLEKYFNPKELEVYRTGLLLGAVIAESLKSALPLIEDDSANIETGQITTALTIFRDKLNSSKPNLSAKTAENFSEMAALADSDLSTPENLKKLFAVIVKIMDSIPFEEDESEENKTSPAPSKTGV